MKKLLLTLIISLGLFGMLNAQHLWDPVNAMGRIIGVASNGDLFASTSEGYLWHSMDGGESWQPLLEPSVSDNNFTINKQGRIFYFNTSNGLRKIYYSDDNGITWSEQPSGISGGWVSAIYSVNNDTLFLCSWDLLFWTQNGGASWKHMALPFYDAETFPLGDLIADEAGNVYVSTYSSVSGNDEAMGIFQTNLDKLNDETLDEVWELKAEVDGGVKQLELCSDGSLVAGTHALCQYLDGVHYLPSPRFAVNDDDVVFIPQRVDESSVVLAYSTDFGEHFTTTGEALPLSDSSSEEENGFLLKGNDKHLYFWNSVENWKSVVDADSIPDFNPWIGERFFDEASDLYYNITADDEVEVTYAVTHFNTYTGDVVIPESVTYESNTYTVTAVGNMAFQNCEGALTSVVVPNTVTSIGELAFASCPHLLTVILPNSVDTLGAMIFDLCSSLTTVRFPEGITVLPRAMFRACSSLSSITIPSTVTRIESSVFEGTGLTSIDIPESVTSIGASAFSSCSFLTSVDVPNTVTELGPGVFSTCRSLLTVHIPENLTTIPDRLFEQCNELESFNIPATVTSIGEAAFMNCYPLTEVVLPDAVTSLGASAFENCSNLESINIPEGVRHLGSRLFWHCHKLGAVTLPEGIDTIPQGLFNACSLLDSIVIPESVTCIEGWAFSSCWALREIVVPDNVTSIGMAAFSDCKNLSKVELGYRLATIGEQAFMKEGDVAKLTLVCHGSTPAQCGYTSFPGEALQEMVVAPCGFEEDYREVWGPYWQSGNFDEDCDFIGSEWYYEILNDDGSVTYQHLQSVADTTINHKEVTIIIRTNTLYDKGEHSEVSREYVYEEDDVIYWWNKELEDFTVLYDNGAEQGDVWEIVVGTQSIAVHVDAVEHYEYEGRLFKMLKVSDEGNLFSGIIVCGIGHLTSFFPEKLMTQGKGYRVEGIRCFWDGDRLIFEYGEKDCDEVYEQYHGVDEDPVTGSIRLYPNPTEAVLYVENALSQASETSSCLPFRIYNVMGQVLMTGTVDADSQQVNVSTLPAGVYYITLAGESFKFVKQ